MSLQYYYYEINSPFAKFGQHIVTSVATKVSSLLMFYIKCIISDFVYLSRIYAFCMGIALICLYYVGLKCLYPFFVSFG